MNQKFWDKVMYGFLALAIVAGAGCVLFAICAAFFS